MIKRHGWYREARGGGGCRLEGSGIWQLRDTSSTGELGSIRDRLYVRWLSSVSNRELRNEYIAHDRLCLMLLVLLHNQKV